MQIIDASQSHTTATSTFIVGPPLTGKTRSTRTWPTPVWIADFDGNAGSLSDVPEGEVLIHRFQSKKTVKIGVTQHRPRQTTVILEFIEWINKIIDMKPDDPKRPKTLVLDSLGNFGSQVLEFVLAMNAREEPVFQDWGQAQLKIKEVIEACKDSGCHFVLTAHEATEKDEVVGRIETIPDTIGKLARQLGGLFDATVYCRKEIDKKTQEPTIQFLTQPDGFVKSAGVRSHVTSKMVPATFEALYPKVN